MNKKTMQQLKLKEQALKPLKKSLLTMPTHSQKNFFHSQTTLSNDLYGLSVETDGHTTLDLVA